MPALRASEVPAPVFSPEQSIGEVLSLLARKLGDAQIEDPQREARFLLQGLLGLDGVDLLARPNRLLGGDAGRVSEAARRRVAHEPITRILGHRDFHGREFIVTPDVLDPRPDTEAAVELALDLIRSRGLSEAPLSIADIGTGSGILIVTLLAELPNARGVATDISPAALAVALRNAEAHGVADRVRFVATTGLAGCPGPFDLVISNPPYIPTGEIDGLDPEVKDYDPRIALDGGADGLHVYRDIARNTVELHGPLLIVLEVGSTQAADVESIFSGFGAKPLGRRRDLGGYNRAVALEIHL